MHCSDFRTQLDRRLDERLAPADDAELLAHAQVCGRCAQSLRVWEEIELQLATPTFESLPEGFAARVVHNAPRPLRRSMKRRAFGWSVGIAAALAVSFIPTAMRRGLLPNYFGTQSASVVGALKAPWVRETGQQLAQVMIRHVPGMRLAPVDQFDPRPEYWVENMENRFRELSDSVDRATENWRAEAIPHTDASLNDASLNESPEKPSSPAPSFIAPGAVLPGLAVPGFHQGEQAQPTSAPPQLIP